MRPGQIAWQQATEELADIEEIAMTTPTITIPPEAVKAGARKLWTVRKALFGAAFPRKTWEELSDEKRTELLNEAAAACLAMLEAWPGMRETGWYGPAIILPLPTENTNDT